MEIVSICTKRYKITIVHIYCEFFIVVSIIISKKTKGNEF